MIRSKKGITFSIGMIVMLILSVLIFSLSLYFLFNWFGQAEVLKGEIDKQTREQIISALKTGNQKVAIPVAIQEVKRGNPVTFGIGVRNVVAAKQFSISLAFSGAYDQNGNMIPAEPIWMTQKWLGNFRTIEGFTLQKNQQEVMPAVIKADTNMAESATTRKGDYIFNVCVWDSPVPQNCDRTQLDNVYTGKIYQVTMRVI